MLYTYSVDLLISLLTDLKAMDMLEYSKTVLEKVSFNRELFRKELQKSKQVLKEDEIELLQTWCRISFTDKYPDIIGEVFDSYSA